MYGKMQDFTAPVFVLFSLSFLRVSMLYETKESGFGQSGCADFEYDIIILIKRRFPVAHNENSSYKKVHYLGLFRILHNYYPGVEDTHLHQSKYSLKVSSLLCCAELFYSMQGHA